MRIVITGGAGYIGSHTARVLARRGHEVLLYDNLSTGHACLAEGFELVIGDVGDKARLLPVLRGCDAVMHFAAHASVAESVANPGKYFDNNVRAGLCLLETVQQAHVPHFVFSSSCTVYGLPNVAFISENSPREPVNPYGTSKLFFERALDAYQVANGLRCVSLRYFNAAGADESNDIGELHDPETHLIPLALGVAAGLRPELVICGNDYPTSDGTCVRDYVHVNDLAEAHSLALDYLSAGGDSTALNLGTGKGHSVNEVVTMLESRTGCVLRKRYGPRRPGDAAELVADPTRAQSLLGWKPIRTLDQIIATAWAWFQRCQTPLSNPRGQHESPFAQDLIELGQSGI